MVCTREADAPILRAVPSKQPLNLRLRGVGSISVLGKKGEELWQKFSSKSLVKGDGDALAIAEEGRLVGRGVGGGWKEDIGANFPSLHPSSFTD